MVEKLDFATGSSTVLCIKMSHNGVLVFALNLYFRLLATYEPSFNPNHIIRRGLGYKPGKRTGRTCRASPCDER